MSEHVNMSYATKYLSDEIREARIRKGLSQRELGTLTGLPQSHISKIESGSVDIRVSSLIELARALDLELFVAPKTTIPAIKTIIRLSKEPADADKPVPAYSLGDDDGD